MKLHRPDIKATEKWKSKNAEFEVELKSNYSLREVNTIYGNAQSESAYDQNRYVVSTLATKILTELIGEDGKPITEFPRDEVETNGVYLITEDFLEMLPPVVFMELADVCLTKAWLRMSEVEAKN